MLTLIPVSVFLALYLLPFFSVTLYCFSHKKAYCNLCSILCTAVKDTCKSCPLPTCITVTSCALPSQDCSVWSFAKCGSSRCTIRIYKKNCSGRRSSIFYDCFHQSFKRNQIPSVLFNVSPSVTFSANSCPPEI